MSVTEAVITNFFHLDHEWLKKPFTAESGPRLDLPRGGSLELLYDRQTCRVLGKSAQKTVTRLIQKDVFEGRVIPGDLPIVELTLPPAAIAAANSIDTDEDLIGTDCGWVKRKDFDATANHGT